jgi:RimJ/RimL family protein N-acetyltransferase
MSNQIAFSPRLVLHPYTLSMVPKYHAWMQDEELLRLTGSEPLSLEEEMANQESWVTDPLKHTFILCDRAQFDPERPEESMIGDLNLFLIAPSTGELSIMIADSSYRRKGLAREALVFMLDFAKTLHLGRLEAKIQTDNTGSIGLFRGLGFVQFAEEPVFNEVHLELVLS